MAEELSETLEGLTLTTPTNVCKYMYEPIRGSGTGVEGDLEDFGCGEELISAAEESDSSADSEDESLTAAPTPSGDRDDPIMDPHLPDW